MEAHLRAEPASDVEEADVASRDFEEFYGTNHRRLFTALCLVTGDREEAEEIAQDAFLRVYERWDRVARMDDPDGYLFRVAMNQFRNRYRRMRLAVRRTFLPGGGVDELAEIETRDQIVRLLQTLAPRERAAIVLTGILDLPAEEAGRMLGIKSSTVRTLTTRARAHMKDQVVDPG
jgi:RNA polymerase sigma-70 factor (ECF subfamily)